MFQSNLPRQVRRCAYVSALGGISRGSKHDNSPNAPLMKTTTYEELQAGNATTPELRRRKNLNARTLTRDECANVYEPSGRANAAVTVKLYSCN